MIQIWKVDKFHGADYFVQKIGYDGFQWIMLRKGKFYQDKNKTKMV
jgi:hypothetical protein